MRSAKKVVPAVLVIANLTGMQLARGEYVFTDQKVFKNLQGRGSFGRKEPDEISIADFSGNGRHLTLLETKLLKTLSPA
jgi:hypothetical protein